MILLTRLNGPVFAINPDLIERAEATPDTVVTLVDGRKHVVTESLAELVELVRDYRASVIARAQYFDPADTPLIADGSHARHRDNDLLGRRSGDFYVSHDDDNTPHLNSALSGAHTAAVVPLHRKDV